MIREITKEDIPTLVAYGEFFWTRTPYVTTGMEYNPQAVEDLLLQMSKDHYIRVAEVDGEVVGFVGILISPLVFNPNYTMATEVFFFVHPESRGTIGTLLMQHAEKDLKDKADIITFGEMRSSQDLDQYYTRKGYVHTETSYSKVI